MEEIRWQEYGKCDAGIDTFALILSLSYSHSGSERVALIIQNWQQKVRL